MNDKPVLPAIVRATLTDLQASIWRHSSGKPPEYLCMATRIAANAVVTVFDRGVDGFHKTRHDDDTPTPPQRFEDLRLHSHYPGHPADDVSWVDWAAFCSITPLVFLSTEVLPLRKPSPRPAEMFTLLADAYPKLWRIGYGQGILRNTAFSLNHDFTGGLQFDQGCLIYDVGLTYFRGGGDKLSDQRTLAAHALFDYPGPVDYGAPIVTETGALAGVMIGADFGSGAACHAAYIPTELFMPFFWQQHAIRRVKRHHMHHHQVIHHALPDDEC